MRVETNWKLVRRNRRLANFLFFFSMAVLIGGFIIANTQLTNTTSPDNLSVLLALILPWVVLPLGFISTLASVRMTNLWMRRPRPEDAIREALKGISKRSVLYNYYHFPARHVLVTPHGVFAMVTRYQEGSFTVDGDRWKAPGGAFRLISRIFRRDDIGNPTEEALRAAAHVKSLIAAVAPNIEVQPLIIFVDPRVRLEINNPTVPVLFADSKREPNLRDYLREHARQQSPQEVTPVKKKHGKPSRAVAVIEETAGTIAPEEIAEALEQAIR
ncbi:MAG: NERD domain-containing protein [Chloroflexi bacterium]|nr:NERD domain-containing protein [Chloroflexota bacterium]